ncbi:MAG: hypothetical protein WCO30_02245 [bacterium]
MSFVKIKTTGSKNDSWQKLLVEIFNETGDIVFNALATQILREQKILFREPDEFNIEFVDITEDLGFKNPTVYHFVEQSLGTVRRKYRSPNIEVALRYFKDYLKPNVEVLMPVQVTIAFASGDQFVYMAKMKKGTSKNETSYFDVMLFDRNYVFKSGEMYLVTRHTPDDLSMFDKNKKKF